MTTIEEIIEEEETIEEEEEVSEEEEEIEIEEIKGEKEIEREPLGGLISNSISARVTLSVVTIGSEKKSSRFISSVT